MKHYSQMAFVTPSALENPNIVAALRNRNCPTFFHYKSEASSKNVRSSGMLALGSDASDGSMVSSVVGGQPTGVYEAVMPQAETLAGMGFIIVLCVALYWVWDKQVVPVSRTKLAISKSRGEVKEYLDELKATSPSVTGILAEASSSEATSSETASPMDSAKEPSLVGVAVNEGEQEVGDETLSPSTTTAQPAQDRAFERWLFTDWLEDNKSERKAGRQKEPALPILKDAKWNSGDNPVVVAAFLMLVGILFTVLTERMTTFG